MIVLKILAAPVMVALSLLAAMVTFLFCVASAVCELGCIVLTLLSLILFIGGQTVGGIVFLVLAFLVSPFGVPAIAEWLVDKLHSAKFALRDFIIGLSMKVLLANQIGGLWRQVKTIGFESVSTPMAWLGLVAYSLQLYLDFCGYSWMAIGVGEMLGFRLPRNFEHPYAARSMRDFWRRWHISLSSWFRDYVYIPLGGSKKGEGRTYLNLLVVWLFTGLWHGSTLNFLLWGLFLFALISLERLGWGKVLRRSQVISRLYMILVIPLSWMLFAIPSLKDIGSYIGRLFAFSGGTAVHARDFLVYGRQYAVVLVIGLLVSTPLPEKLWRRIRTSPLGTVLLLVLFWVCVYCMAVATNDPFMYFSF